MEENSDFRSVQSKKKHLKFWKSGSVWERGKFPMRLSFSLKKTKYVLMPALSTGKEIADGESQREQQHIRL